MLHLLFDVLVSKMVLDRRSFLHRTVSEYLLRRSHDETKKAAQLRHGSLRKLDFSDYGEVFTRGENDA